jgi:hypothetical protein
MALMSRRPGQVVAAVAGIAVWVELAVTLPLVQVSMPRVALETL